MHQQGWMRVCDGELKDKTGWRRTNPNLEVEHFTFKHQPPQPPSQSSLQGRKLLWEILGYLKILPQAIGECYQIVLNMVLSDFLLLYDTTLSYPLNLYTRVARLYTRHNKT